MGAVFAGMINLVTIRDMSIMIAVAGVLAALTVMAVRERSRLQRAQSSRNPPK
jgi:hypothetical protein